MRLIETETSARILNCWLDGMKFAAEDVARQETRVEESWNTKFEWSEPIGEKVRKSQSRLPPQLT